MIKVKLCFFLLCLLFHAVWSETTTITLQNGVYGYDGCVDAGICDASEIDVTNFSIDIAYCIS